MTFRTNVVLVLLLVILVETSYARVSSVISKPPIQMTSSLRSSMQTAATPSITKIEFNSMPPAQRPQISNGKFQCLYPDGISDLYNEMVDGRQFAFRCLKGTKCYRVPNRPNEIKCAYAPPPTPVSSPPERFSSEPTSAIDSIIPTSPVLMASEKFFVGSMAPTSSEPRVISVDVVLPTIVIEITEDPNGPPNLSTVISVNPTNGSIKDDVEVETVTTTEVVPRPDRLDDFRCVSDKPVPTVYDYNELLKIMRESVTVPPLIPFMPRTTPMESTYVPPMSLVSSSDQMDPPNSFSPWPTPAPEIAPYRPMPPAVVQQPKKPLAQPFGRLTPPPPINRPRPAVAVGNQPMTTHDGLLTIVANSSIGLSDGLSSALQHQQQSVGPAKTPHPMLPNDPRPPMLMSGTNNRPIVPFVSNGTRQSAPPMTPSANESTINNNGIVGILQDILHIPPDAITIDGQPVVVKTAAADDDTDVEDEEGQPKTEKSLHEDDLENDNRFRGGGSTSRQRPKGNIKIKDPSTRTVVINGGTRTQIAHHHQNAKPIKGGSTGRFPESVVRLAQSVDEEAEDYDTLGPPPSLDQDYLL